ncbi:magnesium transporter [Pseudonocardiaceae bacterium YIM PH 21723]|nr:magnesium transporter [Pseudonocardiaceae bacterium YIM PH 21723]
MTSPFAGQSAGHTQVPRLPTPPTGWPIGQYTTYEEAQRAVDFLSDNQFPVEEVTIVGVDLMLVERITGRLTWRRVLTGGAASGAWFGLFVGVLLSFFNTNASMLGPVAIGVVTGLFFGLVFAAATYAATRGQRDFVSASQLVAGRYDVLCQPKHAEAGRDLLAKLNMGSGAGQNQ